MFNQSNLAVNIQSLVHILNKKFVIKPCPWRRSPQLPKSLRWLLSLCYLEERRKNLYYEEINESTLYFKKTVRRLPCLQDPMVNKHKKQRRCFQIYSHLDLYSISPGTILSFLVAVITFRIDYLTEYNCSKFKLIVSCRMVNSQSKIGKLSCFQRGGLVPLSLLRLGKLPCFQRGGHVPLSLFSPRKNSSSQISSFNLSSCTTKTFKKKQSCYSTKFTYKKLLRY